MFVGSPGPIILGTLAGLVRKSLVVISSLVHSGGVTNVSVMPD